MRCDARTARGFRPETLMASPSWRLSPDMPWFRKKKDKAPDPALAQAQERTIASLAAARRQRDSEQRRLHDERSTVVQPLKDIHASNHLADLALQALRRRA
jgi:hypothetical protein